MYKSLRRHLSYIVSLTGSSIIGSSSVPPLQVRLSGGSNYHGCSTSESRGRVEVAYNGSWGTMCDQGWDINDATVVCRMLGYDGALEATGAAWFGEGCGEIMLSNVDCSGTEGNLADCVHDGLSAHQCGHHEDAGVICNQAAGMKR